MVLMPSSLGSNSLNTSRPRRPLAALLTLAVALTPALAPTRHARADEPTAPSPTAPAPSADDLFRRAGQLYDAAEYAAAHALYEQVFAHKKTHDVAAMLAQTELKLGRPCDADAHLTFAVETFPPSLADERRARVLRAQADVKKRIGTLRVDTVPASARVLVDFQPFPRDPSQHPACLAAGDHLVFVEHDGHAVERRTVTVDPGADVALTVELRRVSVPTAPSPSPPTLFTDLRPARPLASGPPDVASPVALGVLATGASALVAASILLPLAQARADEADRLASHIASGGSCSLPTDFAADCQRLFALRTDAAGFANAGLASLVTGTVLGAAAGGFFALRASKSGSRPGGPRLTVGVAPGGAHAALTGVF
jgi:hypothetical protein